jgi:S1-C subfamily serine protease
MTPSLFPYRHGRLWRTGIVSVGLFSTTMAGVLSGPIVPVAAEPGGPMLVSQLSRPNDVADEFYRRGNRQFDQGDYNGAIQSYSQALRMNPSGDNAYNNRGNARLALKDIQGAINDYNQALRINPNHALAYYNRGSAYADLGNNRQAILDYTQSLRINPNYAKAYNNRGVARSSLGDHAGAIEDYNRAIRIDPNYTKAINNRASAQRLLGRQMAGNPGNTRYPQENLPPRLDPTAPNPNGRLLPRIDPTAPNPNARLLPRIDPTAPNPDARAQPRINPDSQPVSRIPPQPQSRPIVESSPPPRGNTNTPAPASVPTTPTGSPVAAANVSPNSGGMRSVYQIANETTVLIDGQAPGSGVIIGRKGNNYYVLTAKHVVDTQDEYTVVTSNGKKYSLDYKLVRKLTNLDLAVVQFTSNDTLPVAHLGNSEQVNQGDSIFVSGWPKVTAAITQPTLQVTDGRVTGRQQGDTAGYELTYSNPTAPGMSGGPVFDANGKVIGIHGRAAGDQEVGKVGINLGIPTHLFLRQAPQAGLNLQELGLQAVR